MTVHDLHRAAELLRYLHRPGDAADILRLVELFESVH